MVVWPFVTARAVPVSHHHGRPRPARPLITWGFVASTPNQGPQRDAPAPGGGRWGQVVGEPAVIVPMVWCIEDPVHRVVGAPCLRVADVSLLAYGPVLAHGEVPAHGEAPVSGRARGRCSSVSPGSCVTSRWRRARDYAPGSPGQDSHAGVAAVPTSPKRYLRWAGTTGGCCAARPRRRGQGSGPCGCATTAGAHRQRRREECGRRGGAGRGSEWGRGWPPSQPRPQWCFGADRSSDQHPGSRQGPGAVGRRNRSWGSPGRVSNPPKSQGWSLPPSRTTPA